MAANWAPPAKTRVDISTTSAVESPLPAATAPKRRPMGMAAMAAGVMSRRPARASRPNVFRWGFVWSMIMLVCGLMPKRQSGVLDESAALRAAIDAGSHPHAGLEDAVEVALVEEAAGGRHVAGRLPLPQEPGRGAEAPVEEIGVGREARLLLEG